MRSFLLAAVCTLFLLPGLASAEVEIKDPWARATRPGQKVGAAYMSLTAQHDARLIGARSPVAGRVEIHEMKMQGDVMKMRALEALALPAGKTIVLEPGGYHIMLLDLEKPLREGESVPLTLIVEDKDGKREEIAVNAPVRAPVHGMGSHHMHQGH